VSLLAFFKSFSFQKGSGEAGWLQKKKAQRWPHCSAGAGGESSFLPPEALT